MCSTRDEAQRFSVFHPRCIRKTSQNTARCAALLAVTVFGLTAWSHSAHADGVNWTGALDSDWGNAGNWTGPIPGSAPGDIAIFGTASASAGAVLVNGGRTLGSLLFDNAAAYSLEPGSGGQLFFDNGTNGALISLTNASQAQAHAINVPIEFDSNTTLSFNNIGQDLVLGGVLSNGTANFTAGLAIASSGLLVFNNASAHTMTGTLTISPASTVQVGTGGTTGSLPAAVSNLGTIIFFRSDLIAPFAAAPALFTSGTGTISQSGSGTLSLTNVSNLYIPTLNANHGTILLGSSSFGLGSGNAMPIDVEVHSSATLVVGSGAGTLDLNAFSSGNAGSGGGIITVNLAGSLTLGAFTRGQVPGTNTQSSPSATTLSLLGGTIVAGADDTSTPFFRNLQGVSAVVQTAGAQFNLNSHAITIAEPLRSGSPADGGLTVSGPGTMTLAAPNEFNGATSISSGAVVAISADANLGNTGAASPINFNGGTLRVNGSLALDNRTASQAGLVHQYTFNDNTANDAIGTANGTASGNVTISSGALHMTGGTGINHIDLPGDGADATSAIKINTFTNASIVTWFDAPAATNANLFSTLFTFGATNTQTSNGSGYGYLIANARDGSGRNRAAITSAVEGQNGSSFESAARAGQSQNIIDPNKHMLVTVVNGSSATAGTIQLYIDGVLCVSTSLSSLNGGTSLAKLSNLEAYIGASPFTSDPAFNGDIDEFSIYNSALSASAIAAAYQAGPVTSVAGSINSRNISLGSGGGTFDIAGAASTLTVSGIISGNGPLSVTSGGTLFVSGPANYSGTSTSGTASTIRFGGGISHTAGAFTGPGKLLIDAGTRLQSDGVATSGLWTINGTQNIRPGAGFAGTSKVSAVPTIAHTGSGTSASYTGLLNLADNALIIQSTDPLDKTAKIAALNEAISSGAAGSSWTGNGITSSIAANDAAHLGVGVFDNGVLGKTSFAGQSVDTSSIFVAVAHLGDTNRNGITDIQDLTVVANNWQQSRNSWTQGDLNRDGLVDIQDFTIVANNWQQTSSFSQIVSLLSAFSGSTTPVPEPASLAVLALGTASLLLRRRRGIISQARAPESP